MKWLIILLIAVNSFAATTPSLDPQFPIKDIYLAPVWGYITTGGQSIDKKKYPQTELTFSMPKLFDNKIKLQFNSQKYPAPLAIFIPGSFSHTDRRQAIHITNYLLASGYNVVRIPNTISTEYLELLPKHQFGDFIASSHGYSKLTAKIKAHLLAAQKITSSPITLIGVSHGAFTSAVVAAQTPKMFKQVLLLSPPIDMLTSTQALDIAIDENSSHINLKRIVSDLISLIPLFIFDIQAKDIDQNHLAPIAKDLITFGTFQGRLLRSINLHLEQQGITNPFPSFKFNFLTKKYWQWRANVKFLPLIKKYSPDGWKALHTPKITSTLFWTEQITRQHTPVTIISAQDDFINVTDSWRQHPPYLYILKNGGHYGYRNQKWFKEYLLKLLSLDQLSSSEF